MTESRTTDSGGAETEEAGAGQGTCREPPLHHLLDHPRGPRGRHSRQGSPGPGGPRRHLQSPERRCPADARLRSRLLPRGGDPLGDCPRAISFSTDALPSAAAEQPGDFAPSSPPMPRKHKSQNLRGPGSDVSLECRVLCVQSRGDDGSDTASAWNTCAAASPARDAVHCGATEPRRPTGWPAEADDIGKGDGDRPVGPAVIRDDLGAQEEMNRQTTPCDGPMSAASHRDSSAPALSRRRITGKRKPNVDAPHKAGGRAAGRANSSPRGDSLHENDAYAEFGTSQVLVGARPRGETGGKRTRVSEECRGLIRIGSEDRPPARACGEMNTVKFTYVRRGGLGAAGAAAQRAHAAAAASPSAPSSRAET